MSGLRITGAALHLLLFAFAAATVVSFFAVVGAAIHFGPAHLALLFIMGALALEAAKIGLPVEAHRLFRRGDVLPARAVAALWVFAFAICAAAAFTFTAGPYTARDNSAAELLARKEAALRSMERTRDREELDHEVYKSYAKRIGELRGEIAELRTKPPATVSVGPAGLAGQLMGLLGVVNEVFSGLGLLVLRWAAAREDERVMPEPPAPMAEVPPGAGEPLLLPQAGPAFLEASARVDPSKATAWLFPGVLPLGALTLLTGQPKTGKSTIAINFAATVSAGGRWPMDQMCEPGGVILAEVEDSFADTQARLLAAGADLRRIFVRDREQGPLDLSGAEGMAALTGQAAAMGGVRLAVLSPLLAFFGKAGATDDATVRARLSRLLLWAAQNRVAVLGLLHPAKNAGKGLEAQFAGADGYRRAARSAFVAMPDASDPEPVVKRKRRVLVCAGVNGWSDDQRYFYRIEGVQAGGAATSRVVWLPAPAEAMDEAAETENGSTGERTNKPVPQRAAPVWPVRIAEEWLLDRLTGVEPLPSTAVIAEAAGEGIAERTLRRAAKNVCVIETTSRIGEASLWALECPPATVADGQTVAGE